MKKIPIMQQLLGKPYLPYQKFHEKTKIKRFLPKLPKSEHPKSWKTVTFKQYPRLDKIVLPDPFPLTHVSLQDVLMERKTIRKFSRQPLPLDTISTLLYWSSGLRDTKPPWQGKRFYPSGGALYPLETYILSLNSDIPIGLYHYNLLSHSLEVLLQDKKIDIKTFFPYKTQPWLKKSSCFIITTACFKRNTTKYADHGYRQILMEMGHLAQNIYLLCTALEIALCPIGMFLDDKLNALLDLDSVEESAISVIAVGNKANED